MEFSAADISAEAKRLTEKLQAFEYTQDDCMALAPITLEINSLKSEKHAVILAHSYQTPDIVYGVADHVGDSYGLAVEASKTDAKIIVFSSVLFMGETAKILNPEKTVLVPTRAGCSLADSITGADVVELRRKYSHAGFVAYVNTTADVKAEVDACCTSSNALKIIEAMPQEEIVFLPDVLMGKNLQKLTKKKLILWNGTCVVHERFKMGEVAEVKREYPQAKILAHPECEEEVIEKADFIGSTEQMLKHMEASNAQEFMMVTECGLSDRARKELPNKTIVGTCHLCPYMKEVRLRHILHALKNPTPSQVVELDPVMMQRAKQSLDKMFELEGEYEKYSDKKVTSVEMHTQDAECT